MAEDEEETEIEEGRPTIARWCACFAVFTILLIVTCTIGSFIYFRYGDSVSNVEWPMM